jgi:hypothetical protein
MLDAPEGRQNDRKVQSGGAGMECPVRVGVRADGIPLESIASALVVIPTNSPQNHSKSNSAVIGK